MSKKKLSVVMVPILLLGLTACNNNDAALNTPNNDNGTNVVNRYNDNNDPYRVNNRNNNNPYNVNNNNNNNNKHDNNGMDNRGPLTEDYTNPRFNNNNRANRSNDNNNLFNVNNNNNGSTRANNNNNLYNVNNNNNNGDHQGPLTEDYTNDWNKNKNSTRNINNDNNSVISNYSTSMSSKQYPHTRAVLIQEARYQFLPTDPRQDTRQQAQLRQRREATAQAPTQQQPQQPQQQQSTQAPAQQQQQTAPANSSQAVQQVIDLTNAQRKQNGLPALVADAKLNSVAQMKSTDMQKNNYFSHTSPTYGSPFDMMRDQGVSYRSAGENIAQGQRTPQEVVQAWMNSEGHRRNILSRDYTHIGVGYDSNGHHWTQMFIKK